MYVKKGIYTIVTAILLIAIVSALAVIIWTWSLNYVKTHVNKLRSTEFSYVKLEAYKYDSRCKVLTLYITAYPRNVKVNIYVVKDGDVICKAEKITISEPSTKVSITCSLSSGKYIVKVYDLNNVFLGSFSITIS